MWDRWLGYGVAFLLAAAVCGWLTPRLRDAAVRFGILDRPDGALKQQEQAVPYLGGLAIYLGFVVTLAVVEGSLPAVEFRPEVLGILLAGSIVVIVGLIDDLGQLQPGTKLAGQCLAAWVLIKADVSIQLTFVPDSLAPVLTVLWVVTVINAVNLTDIMDGLAAGITILAALFFLVAADLAGKLTTATLLAALAGACLGFLRFNFAPAQIYMGDAGSQFLGLMLGALSLDTAYTHHGRLGALAPLLVLGVPLFDVLFVSVVRLRRGQPFWRGSPDHVVLRLRRWRLTTRQTVLGAYGLTLALGLSAIALISVPSSTGIGILAFVACCGLGVAWTVGHLE